MFRAGIPIDCSDHSSAGGWAAGFEPLAADPRERDDAPADLSFGEEPPSRDAWAGWLFIAGLCALGSGSWIRHQALALQRVGGGFG